MKDQANFIEPLALSVQSRYIHEYNNETKQIEKVRVESLDMSNVMALYRKKPNTMQINVQELTENFIKSNGQQEEGFKFYFAGGQGIVANTPYVEQSEDGFYGEVRFFFDYQFSYNNYKASFIDSLVKLATILVVMFMVWVASCWFVKREFYKELRQEIIKVDNEIQVADGSPIQTPEQAIKRCADHLSFSRVYFNQFQVKRLQ
jgi:hypothetical protein